MNSVRNFLITLRCYPLVVALNITGLGFAIAVAYMIAVQVHYEVSYNKGIKDADRVAVIFSKDKGSHLSFTRDEWFNMMERKYIEIQANNPAIEQLAVFSYDFQRNCITNHANEIFPLTCAFIDRDALEMFAFDFIDGDADKLHEKNSVAVSESAARRHNLRVGTRICFGGLDHDTPKFTPDKAKTVVAVYRNQPKNSILGNIEMLWYDARQHYNPLYARVHKDYSFAQFDSLLSAVHKAASDDEFEFYSVPLSELYFHNLSTKVGEGGNVSDILTLIAIAVVVVCIAFINYVNFFLSLITRRVRSANTMKIMGATMGRLRLDFILESLLMVTLALVVAFVIVEAVSGGAVKGLFTTSVAVVDNVREALLTFVVAMGLAFLSAVYPAFYVTHSAPAMVVKGSFANVRKGTRLRYILMLAQFVASFVLILVALFIEKQNSYVMQRNMGFDKECVLVTSPLKGSFATAETFDHLVETLKRNPNIIDAAYSLEFLVSSSYVYGDKEIGGPRPSGAPDKLPFATLSVSPNFLRMMGIDILEGRDFEEGDCGQGNYIINSSAHSRGGLSIGNTFKSVRHGQSPIVGVCRDINIFPLRDKTEFVCFYPWKPTGNTAPRLYVKVARDCNVAEVSGYIGDCVDKFFSGGENRLMEIEPFDDIMQREYRNEQLKALQISSFATVAIIVSLMGLLAAVLFEVRYMEREIALRRVSGATVSSIVWLINVKYLRMVALSFLIALPVSVSAVNEWLGNFAYKTALSPWIFALVLLLVASVSAFVVTLTAWRTANSNPIEILNKG